MWLLKLHFSISILCLLTFLGFRMISREQIKENGYGGVNKKKSAYFIFFVPILNILSVIVLLMMITMKKDDLEKKCEEWKNESSDGK